MTAIYRASAVLDIVRRYAPDVVLLDVGMHEVTGFEVARQLRDELRDACPLLIATTAWKEPAARDMATLVGFNHYLPKPYAIDALLELLAPLPRRARRKSGPIEHQSAVPS